MTTTTLQSRGITPLTKPSYNMRKHCAHANQRSCARQQNVTVCVCGFSFFFKRLDSLSTISNFRLSVLFNLFVVRQKTVGHFVRDQRVTEPYPCYGNQSSQKTFSKNMSDDDTRPDGV